MDARGVGLGTLAWGALTLAAVAPPLHCGVAIVTLVCSLLRIVQGEAAPAAVAADESKTE